MPLDIGYMEITQQTLIQVLHDLRNLLGLPDNNFCWSVWANAEDAIRELDDIFNNVQSEGRFNDDQLSYLCYLFSPGGSIQDVSFDSGWSEEYLTLSARFDAAVTDFARRHNNAVQPTPNSRILARLRRAFRGQGRRGRG